MTPDDIKILIATAVAVIGLMIFAFVVGCVLAGRLPKGSSHD
jgi:hypothetical protein